MKIRVAICQVDMEWENTARNLKRLEPIVAAADADVVVLPEMFATGFKLRPSCVAEPADGLVVTTMRRWAAQYGQGPSWAVSSSPSRSGSATGCSSSNLGRDGVVRQTPSVPPRRRSARLYARRPTRDRRIHGLPLPAAGLLRPALSGVEPPTGAITTPFCAAPRGPTTGARCGCTLLRAAPSRTVLSGGREPCRYGSRRKLCGRFGADRLRRPDAGRRRRPRTDADRRIRLRSSDGLQGEISRMDGCRRLRTEVLRL